MKKIILILLVFTLLINPTFAFSGGTGTSSDPYLISTLSDLNQIKTSINTSTVTYFKLINDINAYNTRTWTWNTNNLSKGTGWEPIGNSSYPGYLFHLNGDGFKITNLYTDVNSTCTGNTYAGFIGVATAQIINIGFEDFNINSKCGYCGIFAGVVSFVYYPGSDNNFLKNSYTSNSVIGGSCTYKGSIVSDVLYSRGLYNVYSANNSSVGAGLIRSGGSAINSYWDTNLNANASSVGTGKTSEEMKVVPRDVNVYKDWNFNNIWVQSNGTYPKLNKQLIPSQTIYYFDYNLNSPSTTFSNDYNSLNNTMNVNFSCTGLRDLNYIEGQTIANDEYSFDAGNDPCTSYLLQPFVADANEYNYLTLKKGLSSSSIDGNLTINICNLNSQSCSSGINDCQCVGSDIISFFVDANEWNYYGYDSNFILGGDFNLVQGTKYGLEFVQEGTGEMNIKMNITSGYDSQYLIRYAETMGLCMQYTTNTRSVYFELGKTTVNDSCEKMVYKINDGEEKNHFMTPISSLISQLSCDDLGSGGIITAPDETNQYNATRSNVNGGITGKVNNAYGFNGTTSYIYYTNWKGFKFDSNESFSFNFWLQPKLDTTGLSESAHEIILDTSDYGPNTGYTIYLNDVNGICFNSNGSAICSPYGSITAKIWNMISITRSSAGVVNIYINGSNVVTGLATTINRDELGQTSYIGRTKDGYLYFDGNMDEFSVYDNVISFENISYLYNSGSGIGFIQNPNSYGYIESVPNDYNIRYYSVSNNGVNEIYHNSYFSLESIARFRFLDENTGLDLNQVIINFNDTNYYSDSNSFIDINLAGITSKNYVISIDSNYGDYSTRYYQVDLNQYSLLDVNIALLPTSLTQEVEFTLHDPTTTILTNTYLELIKPDKNNYIAGRLKTNSSGKVSFNLSQTDTNYIMRIADGKYTYYPVPVTIQIPLDEQTPTIQVTPYNILLTGGLYYSDTNETNAKVIYLLSNTTLDYSIQIQDPDGEYNSRTYQIRFPGQVTSYSLQPYLLKSTKALLTVLYTLNASTNQTLGNININIYDLSGTGYILVESKITDSSGQALVTLVQGKDYYYDVYDSNKTYYTKERKQAILQSVYFYLSPSTNQIDINETGSIYIRFNPTKNNLSSKSSDRDIIITTECTGLTVTYQDINIVQINSFNGNIIDMIYSYDGNTNTCGYARTIDIDSLGIVDWNTPITIFVVTTTSDGVTRTSIKTYFISKLTPVFDFYKNISETIRTDLGCNSNSLIPCPILLMISFFVTLMALVGVAKVLGVGTKLGVVGLICIAFFTYVQWIPFPIGIFIGIIDILLLYLLNKRGFDF